VLALTVGDYLLWNWSLNGNHDVIALASGLTLPPLALVSLWVLALAAMKLLAAGARLRRSPSVGPGTRAAPAESSRRPPARATAAGAHEDTRRIAA
jgi:hypothetical protein